VGAFFLGVGAQFGGNRNSIFTFYADVAGIGRQARLRAVCLADVWV